MKDRYTPESVADLLHKEQEDALIRAGEGQVNLDTDTDRRHAAGLVAVKVWEKILETDIDKLRAEVEEWREVGRCILENKEYLPDQFSTRYFFSLIRRLIGEKP